MRIEGDILGAAFENTAKLNFPRQAVDNPQIERMWASKQVEWRLRQARLAGETSPQSPDIGHVIRLCEEYSIVSEYASFIVLENDGEYQRWKIERRNANRIQRDRAARQRVTRQLAKLRRRTLDELGTAVAAADPEEVDLRDEVSRISPPVLPAPAANAVDFQPGFERPRGGGGGGGGAIDPITGLLAAGLAGASALAARRRRRKDD